MIPGRLVLAAPPQVEGASTSTVQHIEYCTVVAGFMSQMLFDDEPRKVSHVICPTPHLRVESWLPQWDPIRRHSSKVKCCLVSLGDCFLGKLQYTVTSLVS